MSDTHDTHIIGGHKAAIHNPNVSAEAKDHSKEVLKENFHIVMDGNKAKDVDHVAAGLKSAMHNDQNTEEVKFAAAEKLGELQK